MLIQCLPITLCLCVWTAWKPWTLTGRVLVSSFRCGLFSAPPTVPEQAWWRCCNNNIEGTDCSQENTRTDNHPGQQQNKDYEHEDIVSLYRHIHKTDEWLPICLWHPVGFNMVLLNLILLPLWHSRGQSHRLPQPDLSHLISSVWQCC